VADAPPASKRARRYGGVPVPSAVRTPTNSNSSVDNNHNNTLRHTSPMSATIDLHEG